MTAYRFRSIVLAVLFAAGLAAGPTAADDSPRPPAEPTLQESLEALGGLLREKLEDGLDRARRELEDQLRRRKEETPPPARDSVPADEPMDI